MDAESLRLILGLKLKQYRLRKGYSLKQLAEQTHLSISFLSEIEKGKKYPKPEKIMKLAQVLDISYDELVSLKLDKELNSITTILDSPFIKEFPFQLFGLEPRSVLGLVADSPTKAGAFIRTFLEIAQSYDMRVEHFLLAALRSYQIMHLNYFEDIEEAVLSFMDKHNIRIEPAINTQRLRSILMEEYGYEVAETRFDENPELKGFRSVWIDDHPQKLIINASLLPIQKAFIIGREIGFCYLELQERATTSSWIKVESFEQVLNNFKASYFAGGVLINRDLLRTDLARFFQKSKWDGRDFSRMMEKYRATPEMFLYRLSQLIPKLFDLQEIYYLRFYNEAGSDAYHLTKKLNMSRVRVPHGLGLHEHHCRRWLSISALKQLAQKQRNGMAKATRISAQRSRFIDSQAKFFTITLARRLALAESTNSSISMGLLIDERFKETVKFWNDPNVPEVDVNETCERCGLSKTDCGARVAPPHIYRQEQKQIIREGALREFMKKVGK